MGRVRKQPMSDITPLTADDNESNASQTDAMPSLEELLGRVQRLEVEKNEALETAASFKQQFEKIKAQAGAPAEMSTTITKPVWPFSVSGSQGVERFDVVDESEAKRLYCVKHKIDPSVFVLKVQCEKQAERNASITQQYQDAGADVTRIPGVNLGI
jgi:capsular polysaccharide biosynthesis protein